MVVGPAVNVSCTLTFYYVITSTIAKMLRGGEPLRGNKRTGAWDGRRDFIAGLHSAIPASELVSDELQNQS